MRTSEIAPGNILQRMYLKERLRHLNAGSFLEVGCGTGCSSELLLACGHRGIGFDLNKESCELSRKRNAAFIHSGAYQVSNEDYFTATLPQKYDLIFSSMVIEHLPPELVYRYFQKAIEHLNPNGTLAVFVPAFMKYWSVEDEIVGHYKRYTFEDFDDIARTFSLEKVVCDGLTFPLSNMLLPLSNYLVRRSEKRKMKLSNMEKTILSSNRNVFLKTSFPWFFQIILNEYTMTPFHRLQKFFSKSKDSMVIYCEMKKCG